MSTDRHWSEFAAQDPYYAVCTEPIYRRENMTPAGRQRFFRSGEDHVQYAIDTLAQHFGAPGRFGVSLDFGCGVGRLLLPLARRSGRAIGIDVAEEMRRESRCNAEAAQLDNVELYSGDDTLSEVAQYTGRVDLVISLIVFQHIPVDRGMRIFNALLDLLAPGGFAAVHFTFAAEIHGLPNEAQLTTGIRFGFYQRLGTAGLIRLAGVPDATPIMQMNHYNLNELTCVLQGRGITSVFLQTRNHDGVIGAELYFQRPPAHHPET
jgi:SAM-dependent methyltransferase